MVLFNIVVLLILMYVCQRCQRIVSIPVDSLKRVEEVKGELKTSHVVK